MITRSYPHMMHHAEHQPKSAKDDAHRTQLMTQGYRDDYQHQAYPRMLYHSDLAPRTVANPAEEKEALADGWTREHEMVLVPQTGTSPITGASIALPLNPNGPKVARSPRMPVPALNMPDPLLGGEMGHGHDDTAKIQNKKK
jgi:hypothetical protein